MAFTSRDKCDTDMQLCLRRPQLELLVSAQGDDGLNVHGMFHDVRQLLNSNTFELGSRPACNGCHDPVNVGGRCDFGL